MASRGSRRRPSNRQLKRLVPLIISAVLAMATYAQRQSNDATTTQSGGAVPVNEAPPVKKAPPVKEAPSIKEAPPITGGVPVNIDVGFRSQQRLDDHYAKHGREFGNVTKNAYLLMAQQLRDAPISSNIIEARQARGNLARFDRSSGGFIAFDDRLIIQTFFRPNDGEAYFRRAIKTNR